MSGSVCRRRQRSPDPGHLFSPLWDSTLWRCLEISDRAFSLRIALPVRLPVFSHPEVGTKRCHGKNKISLKYPRSDPFSKVGLLPYKRIFASIWSLFEAIFFPSFFQQVLSGFSGLSDSKDFADAKGSKINNLYTTPTLGLILQFHSPWKFDDLVKSLRSTFLAYNPLMLFHANLIFCDFCALRLYHYLFAIFSQCFRIYHYGFRSMANESDYKHFTTRSSCYKLSVFQQRICSSWTFWF